MDFPEAHLQPVETPAALLGALGAQPNEVLAAFDYVAVYDSEDQIRALRAAGLTTRRPETREKSRSALQSSGTDQRMQRAATRAS